MHLFVNIAILINISKNLAADCPRLYVRSFQQLREF
nr:MAG TPA: hypothetical protein [Caudoviricetes sp.]DAY73223.1 MAG TPA: hypothetical protein [Caudoviricetes sp.]